jgi:transforming growth factor-beta-induced protein
MKTDLTKLSLLIFLSLSMGLTSCNTDDEDEAPPSTPSPTKNIAELTQGNPQFSILWDALIFTDLVDNFEQSGSLTLFAPNNEAFNTFFDDNEIIDHNGDGSRVDDAATELGVEELTYILRYHAIEGKIASGDVTAAQYRSTLSTNSPELTPLSLRTSKINNTLILNGGIGIGAIVVNANLDATNGILHEIDGVLVMPNVVDHAIANPDLSELLRAVTTTNSWDSLCPLATLTVFAPLNSAFESRSATIEGLSHSQISDMLQYHVLEIQLRQDQITEGNAYTLLGQEFSINFGADNSTLILTDSEGKEATVVLTNVQATNGVVHIIDNVLFPSM